MDREAELVLVSRLRGGDPDAFDAVYEAYNSRLFGFLARLARRRDVAEDLLEETWLRFVTHAGRLRPDTRLAPWLFTVARNLHVSYCRSRSIEESSAVDLVGLWPVGSQPQSPFEAASSSEAGRRLEAALASLPAPSREVLLLVGVEGMRPVDAAAVCRIRPEALRQRLSRARALLEKRLNDCETAHLASLAEVTT